MRLRITDAQQSALGMDDEGLLESQIVAPFEVNRTATGTTYDMTLPALQRLERSLEGHPVLDTIGGSAERDEIEKARRVLQNVKMAIAAYEGIMGESVESEETPATVETVEVLTDPQDITDALDRIESAPLMSEEESEPAAHYSLPDYDEIRHKGIGDAIRRLADRASGNPDGVPATFWLHAAPVACAPITSRVALSLACRMMSLGCSMRLKVKGTDGVIRLRDIAWDGSGVYVLRNLD